MPPTQATERHQIIIGTDLIRRVDDWRRRQEDIPNKSQAIRRLIEVALAAEDEMRGRMKGNEA